MVKLQLDEEQILAFQQRGERDALDALIRRRWKEVYRFCSYHVGPVQAEDVCQQVFLAIARQPYDSNQGAFSSWLYTIALNRCRTVLTSNQSRNRREKVVGGRVMQRRTHNNNTPENQFISNEQAGIAKTLITKLSQQQRLALELHSLQGLSFRDIAPVMGISASKARRLTEEAKSLLRSKMEKLGYTGLSVTAVLTFLREEPIEVSNEYVVDLIAGLHSSSRSDHQSFDNEPTNDAAVSSSGNAGIVAVFLVLPILAVAGTSIFSDSSSKNEVNTESAVAQAESFKEMRWTFDQPPQGIKDLELVEGNWNWKPSGVLDLRGVQPLSINLPKIAEYPFLVEMEISKPNGVTPKVNLSFVDSENNRLKNICEYYSAGKINYPLDSHFRKIQILVFESRIIQFSGSRAEVQPNALRTFPQSQKGASTVLRLGNCSLDFLVIRRPGKVELAGLEKLEADTPISTFPQFSNFNEKSAGNDWLFVESETPVKTVQRNQPGQPTSVLDHCLAANGLVNVRFRPVVKKLPCVVELDFQYRPGVGGYFGASWIQYESRKLQPVPKGELLDVRRKHPVKVKDRYEWIRCRIYYIRNSVIMTNNDNLVSHQYFKNSSPLHNQIFLQIWDYNFDNLGVRYIDMKDLPDNVIEQLKQAPANDGEM